MKALFTGFLTVSISTSLMIGIVLLLRLIFKKAPKALICGVWALVILRLLLPFQIPLEFSAQRLLCLHRRAQRLLTSSKSMNRPKSPHLSRFKNRGVFSLLSLLTICRSQLMCGVLA